MSVSLTFGMILQNTPSGENCVLSAGLCIDISIFATKQLFKEDPGRFAITW